MGAAPKIKIESDGTYTRVWVDGQLVTGITRLEFVHALNESARVLIDRDLALEPIKKVL